MMKAKSTEKSDICERTFAFAIRIVKLCKTLEKTDSGSRQLLRQLLRSGTSIGANMEEAQGGQSRADFISKVSIARKEARETLYWLRLLTACSIVPESRLKDLIRESNELVAILTAIIKTASANSK